MTSTSGRIAAIDFGTVRIGLAISDPDRRWASPHVVYTRKSPDADRQFFRQLIGQQEITLWVVGLPVFASGDESPISRQAREFGGWLQQQTGVPVVYFDERYSTREAENLLAGKLSRAKRKARRDKLAAQILLTAYLESPANHHHPGSLDD